MAELYGKYTVFRNDGRDLEGGDKTDARYFVLDYVHDRHARAAVYAYATSIWDENRALAQELTGAAMEFGSEDTAARLAADRERIASTNPKLAAAMDAWDASGQGGGPDG